jgi:hypothetical protein
MAVSVSSVFQSRIRCVSRISAQCVVATAREATCGISRTDGAVQDMVMPPELPQVKVNKHLMALVQRKMVQKVSKVSLLLLNYYTMLR